MAEQEKKYAVLRVSLIVIFGMIFVAGLLARGAMTPEQVMRHRFDDRSESGWRTTQIENIAASNYRALENRRNIMDRIRENPNNVELHNEMGVALAKDGLLSEAITHFFKVIELDPENAVAYHNLGIIHEYLDAYEEAREYLQKARQLDPENKIISGTLKRVNFVLEYKPDGSQRYESQLNKALVAMGKQNTNLDQAKLILDELVLENPSAVEALNALGVYYAKTGDTDKAKETFFKVISQDPGYIFAYINLSTVFESENDYSQAFNYLERAKNLADDRAAKRRLEHLMREMSRRMPESIK